MAEAVSTRLTFSSAQPTHSNDYDSEYDAGESSGSRQMQTRAARDRSLLTVERKSGSRVPPPKGTFEDELARYERGVERFANLAMTAYERHQRYVDDYVRAYGRAELVPDTGPKRNDFDVIADRHRFVWEAKDEPKAADWEGQLAKSYFDKLFKEFCLADLSRHAAKQLALRWRTGDEVLTGKGHFFCGSLSCNKREGLRSWEVPFAYTEQGEHRKAMVKLRLCPKCSTKLLACTEAEAGEVGRRSERRREQEQEEEDEDDDNGERRRQAVKPRERHR